MSYLVSFGIFLLLVLVSSIATAAVPYGEVVVYFLVLFACFLQWRSSSVSRPGLFRGALVYLVVYSVPLIVHYLFRSPDA